MSQAEQLKELEKFNEENQSKLESIEKFAKEQAVDLISQSDEFESMCGDSVCDSYHSSDSLDSDEEQKQNDDAKGMDVDDDGFATVTEKKRR